MNYNDNDIEVAMTHGGDSYLIDIGDDLTIEVNNSRLFLHINRDYGELTSVETVQLAGALIAMETLAATNRHEAMDALTVALETMNDVREKAGNAPLVDVDEVFARADVGRVRDDLMYLLKSTRRDQS